MPRGTLVSRKSEPHDAYDGLEYESTVSPRDQDEEVGDEEVEEGLLSPFDEERGENEGKGWDR